MFANNTNDSNKISIRNSFRIRSFSILFFAIALSLLFILPGIFPATFARSITATEITRQNSTSDAGYILVTKSYDTITVVQSSFIVPAVSCAPSETDTSVFFASLGGDGGGFEIGCVSGSSFYDSLCIFSYQYNVGCAEPKLVSPHDKMKVIIKNPYTSGFANLMLTDTTKHWTVSTSISDTSTVNAASWLLQSESMTLADFGAIKTSSNYVTISGHHGTILSFSSSDKIEKWTLVDSMGHTMASTSSISRTGSAFSIRWTPVV